MSDELIKSLQSRITALETENRQLIARRQKARQEAESLKAERDRLQTELDDLIATAEQELTQHDEAWKALEQERDELRNKLEAAPDELQAKIRDLETQVRTRDFRDAFGNQVKDLAEGFTIEDLWKFGEFDPAKVETLEDGMVNEIVGKVRQAKPAMFAKAQGAGTNGTETSPGLGQEKPARKPLTLGDAGSRGARDGASLDGPSIRRSEMATPGWMSRNKAAAEAFRAGTLTVLDD